MIFWILAGLVVLLALLREAWFHIALPALAQVARTQGQLKGARLLLARCLAEPSLFGDGSKAGQRYQLSWFCLEERLYEEAARHLRDALSHRMKPAIEANYRRRLADCLEGMGQTEAAAAERERCRELLSLAPADLDGLLSRAEELGQQRRYAEACEVYDQVLETPRIVDRPSVLVRLSLASYHAGRTEEAIRRAEEALALRPEGPLRHLAHSAAAVGYSTAGRLDEAELHREQAYEVAMEAGSVDQAARYLAGLAALRMKRGNLVQALAECEQAAQMSMEARRSARMTEGECLRLWGRYDPARTAYEQARRASPLGQPAAERRMQAVIALGQTWLEADAGDAAAAGRFLEEAEPELRTDPKLSLWCRATRAWVQGLAGDHERARAALQEVEAELERGDPGRDTRQTCHDALGRAALLLGEPERARAHWEAFLAAEPEPVYVPTARYHLGLCYLHAGDAAAVHRELRQASAPGVDTCWSRRAAKRLPELNGG